jgi:hypothetical protein
MAEAAQPYAQMFIDAGLPQDFIAQLGAAADAVTSSIDTRAAARGRRSSATGALMELEGRARLAFKALSAFVVPILSADVAHSGLLAEWKSARRVDSRGGPVTGAGQAATGVRPSQAPSPSAPGAVTTIPAAQTTPAATAAA